MQNGYFAPLGATSHPVDAVRSDAQGCEVRQGEDGITPCPGP